MSKKIVKLSIFVIFSLLGGLDSSHAGRQVTEMVVEGNHRVEPETIRALLVTEPDGTFSEDSLNQSLKKLFDSGYFADASLRISGTTLIVTVVENPIVNQVAIEGNDEITDDILKSELRLKPRQVFTQSRLKADVERLQTIYRLKGHFAAVVTPKIIRRDQNRVDVIFEITEGKATKVSKIFFLGNTQFGEGKLEETIQTKESRWYRFFTNDDNYDPDRLAYDRELLRLFYLQHGYADFKVKSAVAELTPDKKEFFITFTLDEGARYRLGTINVVSKVPNLDVKCLEQAITLSQGSWYNNKEVEKSIDALTNALGQQGYAFVDVSPNLSKDEANKVVNVSFEIQEGPRVYIDQIRIVGNVRTDDDVIRRELLFHEGDAFNSDKLKKSERRVRNLGYFKNVKFNREPSTFPDKVVIVIELEEDRTGELSVGAGFSTSDGPLGDIRFGEHNFRGRGQDLEVGLTYAKRRQEFDISFTEPYFMGRDLATGIDLYAISQNSYFNQTFDQKIKGVTFRVGYELSEDLRQQIAYTIRQDDISHVKHDASRFIQEQKGRTTLSEIAQTTTYDKRDSRISPMDGYYVGFKNYLAGLGGDVRYLKNGIFGGYYYSLCDGWVLEISGNGNVMSGLGKDVHIVYRYTGGGDELRGFQISGVGDRDKKTGDPLGGKKSYVMTSELTFPLGLPNEFGIKGALFIDAGSVFDCGDPKSEINSSKMIRVGVGGGLRWRSPLGPLKIDLGHAVRKAKFDKRQLVFFGVSTRF